MFLNDGGFDILEFVKSFANSTGIAAFFQGNGWMNAVMIVIAIVLLYLAIFKKVEPYLLLPISFGMLLVNLPLGGVFVKPLSEYYTVQEFAAYLSITEADALTLFKAAFEFAKLEGAMPEALKLEYIVNYVYANQDAAIVNGFSAVQWDILQVAKENNYSGLLGVLYSGVKLGIYPCLIFLGIGATTDFGPLIANPKSMLLGAAAQIGIFITFLGALLIFGFTGPEAASIGIIGGADGPTAIFLTSKLAPELLGPIAVAAYSYMALVPVIQPPIMRALTTKKERQIKMSTLRTVSKKERIIFPIVLAAIISLLLPDAAPLIGCLMLGNLMKECGVVDRLSKTVQNELMNIVVIFLGITVGATATAEAFLNVKTLMILAMGIVAFGVASACGVLFAKLMNLFLPEGKKINPLIGSAGVSAVPMAARVSQKVGQEANPSNFLLMHAMGPNVAGVVGSAVAAGLLLSFLG